MGHRPRISERIAITVSQAAARQRKFKHHHKSASYKWNASTEDMGTQMTAECNPSIGRKYLSQAQAVERWERRTDKLESRSAMMREGAGVRQPHKARNKFSKEEMGTIPNYVGVCRFDNSYITKACYRKYMW